MRETDPSEASTQIDAPRSTDEQYARRPDPRVGLILDSKYKLIESLGQGGMGSIFRAQRLHIGDEVAVKLLHHDLVREQKALERFRREARAAAMIRHPNVVSIHDFNDGSSDAAQPYIVMELVQGMSLGDLLRREGRMMPRSCGSIDARRLHGCRRGSSTGTAASRSQARQRDRRAADSRR